METKFQKFQNALPSIFGTHKVEFRTVDELSYCVRSSYTGMFCGVEMKALIKLADSLELSFYVRSGVMSDRIDFVDFVVY